MSIGIPRQVLNVPAFKPLIDLLESVQMTPGELAERWRLSDSHLSNLRRAGKGIPFMKLPTGAVRYRASHVVSAELGAMDGPITVDAVCLALSACRELSPDARAAAQDAVRAAVLKV